MDDLLSNKKNIESWTSKNALKIVEKNDDDPEYMAEKPSKDGVLTSR
jgi:hypothetical protein